MNMHALHCHNIFSLFKKCLGPFVPYALEVVTVGCGGNGEPSTIINFTKQGGTYVHVFAYCNFILY